MKRKDSKLFFRTRFSAKTEARANIVTNTNFVSLFCRELASLLSAGVSLSESLESLADLAIDRLEDATVYKDILSSLQSGLSLSATLKELKFPILLVASVSASEHTGDLVGALNRYLSYLGNVDRLKSKVVSASLYPIILLVAGCAVAVFLLFYLVPRFSEIYSGVTRDLPWASRVLIEWGGWVSSNPLELVLVVAALAGGALWAGMQSGFRQGVFAMVRRNRQLGRYLQLMELSRFYRSLGLLLGGGVPIVKALDMSRSLLLVDTQLHLDQAVLDVSRGVALSEAFRQQGLATSVALRLMNAGQRNGQLAQMLEQAAVFHDREIEEAIDRFSRLFEPVLMVFIGLLIGTIVVLLYLPVFELVGSIG